MDDKIKYLKNKLNEYIKWVNNEKKEGREFDEDTKTHLKKLREQWMNIKTLEDYQLIKDVIFSYNTYITPKCRNETLWNDYLENINNLSILDENKQSEIEQKIKSLDNLLLKKVICYRKKDNIFILSISKYVNDNIENYTTFFILSFNELYKVIAKNIEERLPNIFIADITLQIINNEIYFFVNTIIEQINRLTYFLYEDYPIGKDEPNVFHSLRS